MLLSKALKMQQDLEDKRQEVIIENLENKIKSNLLPLRRKTSSYNQPKAY
jgi:hypothetical protein